MKLKTSLPTLRSKLLQLAALSIAISPAAVLADEDYEWEAGEGYHEEEWYDPTDWFNEDNQISYEYDYPYYNDSYWGDTTLDYNTWDYDNYDSRTTAGDRDMNNTTYVWDPVGYGWIYYDARNSQNRSNRQASNQRDRMNQQDQRNQRNQQDGSAQRDRQDSGQNAQQDRQEWRESMNRNSKSQQSEGQQSESRQQTKSVSGTVEGFREIDLRRRGGTPESHTFVKLNMENRGSVIVNLGPKKDLQDLDLQRGDQVRIQGKQIRVNDRPVIKAESMMVDGETIRFQQGKSAAQISGTVEQVRRAKVEGRDHLIARLQMQNNRDVLVDLGPDAQLTDFDISEGDEVSIRGRRSTIDGRSVLIANRLSVNGESQNIRTPSKQN